MTSHSGIVRAISRLAHAARALVGRRRVRAGAPALREPGSWRRLKGWEDFRYDPALFRPMDDAGLIEEGWP